MSKSLPALGDSDLSTDSIHITGAVGADYVLSSGAGVDTITLDSSPYIGSITLPSTTITSGGYAYSTGTSSTTYTINPTPYNWTSNNVNISSNGIDMASGTDIKIDGKSLKAFMDKMEERLAILVPNPDKLEKFEALKKAYEHYKLMEKLCQEETKEEK